MAGKRKTPKAMDAAAAASARVAKQHGSKIAVLLAPFVAASVELLVSLLIHLRWGHGPAMVWVPAGIGVSTIVVAAMVWRVGRDRSPVGQLHAVATSCAVGLHLIAALGVGPFTRPLIDLWLWGAGTIAVTWAIRLRIAGAAASEATTQYKSFWEEVAAHAGIEGSRFTPKHVTSQRVKGTLQLEAGATAEEAQKQRASLASALGVARNGVRIIEDPDNASRAEMTVVRQDMLRHVRLYEGPSQVGGTSGAPLRLGIYEDGEPALLPMHVDQLGMAHLLVQGMNGAGKTSGANMIMGEKFTRDDVYTILIDTVKGAQTLRPLLPGLDWVETTEARARAVFLRLKEDVIPYRANYLGRKRLNKWMPGCGIPRLDIHIEEAAGLSDANFVRIMERCRSVGIHVTASLQRASYTAIDVAARQQFSTVLCFGVKDAEDARFSMPDDVLDAGADPAIWQNRKPGYAYLVGPGIPEDCWTLPLRTELITDEDLEQLAEFNARNGAQLDQGTIEAFGELYTSRTPVAQIIAQLDGEPTPTATTTAARTAAPAGAGRTRAPAPEEEIQDAELVAIEFGDLVDGTDNIDNEVNQLMASLPADERPEAFQPVDEPDPDLQCDIDAELPEVAGELRFGQPIPAAVRLSDDEALALFLQRLDQLQDTGVEVVNGPHFAELTRQAGRSSSWIYKRLNQQIRNGRLERTDAGFRFVKQLSFA